ncbi:MAG: DHA2 family efflux MFS transporter permease subunit [Proteobacteria bacterium]|nr:DHA2 family efflux MFS transporter permease subunit [Pseudomonadota bacterium]
MGCIKGFQLVVLTIAVSLGIFMNVLDTSIANVAIPTIAGNVGVSPDEGTWVITSFTVSMAIVLPLTGWLAKRFGEVRLYTICTLLFTLTSILCGLSTSLPMLVFFRVLQGIVAGPMIPLSQSLLLANYPPEKKGLATGLWAMVAVAGPVLGPILGGYITDNYSWPWIFYINMPVGLCSAYFTWRILNQRETPVKKIRVDYIGLILLAIGVGSLQVLLDKGQDLDWFDSNFIVSLAIISSISLITFLIWELTEENPIVDLSLFKNRNFTIGTLALSLGYMIYFGSVVILPLWLQTQMTYTPTWAGLATAPIGIIPLFLSPIIGRVMGITDLRLFSSFGFLIFAICSFWTANFNTSVTFDLIALVRLIQGIGVPCFFIPTLSILFSGLKNEKIASAAGLSNFMRILAGSFGTSITVTLWNHRESVHQSNLVENLTNYHEPMAIVISKLQEIGFIGNANYAQIMKIIIQQAYMMSTNDVFWISGYCFLGLLILIWFAKPPFTSKATTAAE